MSPPAQPAATIRPQAPGFTLVEIMIVVVIIGLLATMAVPGFQKIRVASQDKAVLNNARQLSSAAEQYYHESGFDYVNVTSLVGATLYIRSLNLVARETYPTTLYAATPLTVTGVAGARTITYSP